MDCNFYKKGQQYEYMEIHTQHGLQRILLEEVMFFSSDVRIVEVHLKDENVYRFYGKLDEVQQILGEAFLRCHKSFLVNRKKIDRISREWVWIGGKQIPVSRTCYVKMRQQGLLGNNRDKIQMILEENGVAKGRVRCVSGKYQGAEFWIYPNEKLILGRGYDQADVVLDEPEISREHCWIQYNDKVDRYYICNRSVNGIYVNDVRLEERDMMREAQTGDRLRLADTNEIFEVG